MIKTKPDTPDQDEPKTNDSRARRELDPRAELGLKSPAEDATGASQSTKRQEAQGRKATQYDGNPNPQGSPSTPMKPKDDTPAKLKKTEGPRDDQ